MTDQERWQSTYGTMNIKDAATMYQKLVDDELARKIAKPVPPHNCRVERRKYFNARRQETMIVEWRH